MTRQIWKSSLRRIPSRIFQESLLGGQKLWLWPAFKELGYCWRMLIHFPWKSKLILISLVQEWLLPLGNGAYKRFHPNFRLFGVCKNASSQLCTKNQILGSLSWKKVQVKRFFIIWIARNCHSPISSSSWRCEPTIATSNYMLDTSKQNNEGNVLTK